MKMKNYIHLRNNKYYFRARFPIELVKFIGRKELSRSLKTDSYQEAVQKFPQVMLEYNNMIEVAKRKLAISEAATPQELTEGAVMSLVSDWYQAAKNMYQHDSRAKELTPELSEQRQKFLIETEQSLNLKKQEMLAFNQYDSVRPIVAGIMKRTGIDLDINGQSYGLLCQTVLRAWVNLEEEVVERLKGNYGFKSSDNIQDMLVTQQAVTPLPHKRINNNATGKTVSDLIKAYTAEHGLTWARSTISAKNTVFKFLEAALGKDKPLHDIDREAGRAAFEQLKRLPTNWGKRAELGGLPLDRLIKKAAKLDFPIISTGSINGIYLGFTKPLFDWAVNEQWMDKNPFDGLKSRQTKKEIAKDKENKRTSFTLSQLQTLFNSSPWKPRDEKHQNKPSFFWGPLIGLFHGFRVGEVSGLLVSDIGYEEEIASFILKEHFDDDQDERTLKTSNATRVIPIHPELINMGFLSFVTQQRQAGHRQLFPEEKIDANGKWGRQLTSWFSKHVKSTEVGDTGCTFHSFRHGFQDALRGAGLHGRAEGQALGGRKTDYRSANANSDTVADEYGTRFKVSILKPLIDKVIHEGLDLSHLHVK